MPNLPYSQPPMSRSSTPISDKWQQSDNVFQKRADEYDSWYEDSILFDTELAAIQDITVPLAKPRVELGIGPGRFASQLGVTIGIDPAPAALRHAMKRRITPVAGIGEHLPIQTATVGTLYMLFTLCFLVDPARVLAECFRVLKKEGCLVIGLVPAQSPWGKSLESKKNKGNPFYKHARFYTIKQCMDMLKQADFELIESHSTLLQPPGNIEQLEPSRPGSNEQAGFCVVVVRKKDS